MSKPVFEDLFVFHRARRNRLSFFFFTLLQLVLISAPLVIWAFIAAYLSLADSNLSPMVDSIGPIILIMTTIVIYIPMLIASIAVMTQRCRDMNKTGWWVLLVPLPIVSIILFIVLLLVPGTKGPNYYGPDPLEEIR